jgi:predicted aminopeptidase
MKIQTQKIIQKLLISSFLLLSACSDIGYYWHSARGHMDIMARRVDIQAIIDNPESDEKLRERLKQIKEIRRFAVDKLKLPDNGSYSQYVKLDHPYVLQNLFAAPEFSTRLKTWCYPVAGCTSYRGFFEEDRLQSFVEQLQSDNLAGNMDIHIGKTSAYSTLGWFDDPVLSSFIGWKDYRLAGLLFHELTHQVLYIDDDTEFNESLATAVQQQGTRLWLQSHHRTAELDEFRRWNIYRQAVMSLIGTTRDDLYTLYQKELSEDDLRHHKKQILSKAGSNHQQLANKHEIKNGFKRWFSEGLNNAKLGSISTYNAKVPAFNSILQKHNYDFNLFFKTVTHLGNLPKKARDSCLKDWQGNEDLIKSSCRLQ